MENKVYDVAIIGGGPAGLAAGIYAGRAELKVAVVEKYTAGGQLTTTSEIANYPGFETPIDATVLAETMEKQAKNFGVEFVKKNVTKITTDEDGNKLLSNRRGDILSAKTLIFALGAEPRHLGVPGEDELRGVGVSYCAVCDGAFFGGKTCAVVGGGDTAAADAIYLSKICKKVYLIHRRDELRAAKSYFTELKKHDNIEFVWDSVVKEIKGSPMVSSCVLENVKTGETSELELDGIFVAVGTKPSTKLAEGICELDERGFIKAGEDTKTSAPGVYAAGDCRTKLLRQVVTAVADGAIAATEAGEYLNNGDKKW